MLTLSPRVLAAFAFERGEEFDPALTLVSAPLADDLALLASARALVGELSPAERRRRDRARRIGRASEQSAGDPTLPASAAPPIPRPA
jgi:hypothetical protein